MTGRGGLTVRRRAREWVWTAGEIVNFDELRRIVAGVSKRAVSTKSEGPEPDSQASAAQEEAPVLLPEMVDSCAEAFHRALADRDVAGTVGAILELDQVISGWSADTLESDDLVRAHSILRSLVVRLGEAASVGLRDPARHSHRSWSPGTAALCAPGRWALRSSRRHPVQRWPLAILSCTTSRTRPCGQLRELMAPRPP